MYGETGEQSVGKFPLRPSTASELLWRRIVPSSGCLFYGIIVRVRGNVDRGSQRVLK
jgi:hypothetical protein